MRRWLALTLAVASGALLCVASGRGPFTPGIVHAAQTWNVQVGADINGGTYTANNYYPSVLTINAGDTVTWSFPSVEPHTVTFDNGHFPTVFLLGTQETGTPGEIDITASAIPIGFTPPSSTFDPSAQISIPVEQAPPDQRTPQSLVFNQPGVYQYNCAIHGSLMHGVVIVQSAAAQLTESPAQATARGRGELAAATAEANGAAQQIAPGSTTLPSGQTAYNVLAGAEPGPNVSGMQFFPANLTIHRGDTVTFTSVDPTELHTVTFLNGTTEPDLFNVVAQPNGPPKILFNPQVVLPAGGNVFTGTGYFNSGFLTGAFGQSFTVTFDVPPGTYAYRCMLHGGDPQNMMGTITVE